MKNHFKELNNGKKIPKTMYNYILYACMSGGAVVKSLALRIRYSCSITKQKIDIILFIRHAATIMQLSVI